MSQQHKPRQSFSAMVGPILLLFASASAWCAPQPKIQGSYTVTNETQSGDQVQFTLEMFLFNGGDADLVSGRLTLRDSFLLMKDYGSFAPVSIRAGQSTVLVRSFIIPIREYDLWRKGRQPNLFMRFGGAGGNEIGQRIVLQRLPSNGRAAQTSFSAQHFSTTALSGPPLRHRFPTLSPDLRRMTSSAMSSDLINTIAGGGPNNIPALAAGLGIAPTVAVDNIGNLYVCDFDESRVYKVDFAGTLTILAGNGFAGYSGDGGLAISAELSFPQAANVDSAGNVFIADTFNAVIRKVDPSGIITTLATLSGLPTAVAPDSAGNLLVAVASSNLIQKIDAQGNITIVAGTGTAGYSGDGGPATTAELNNPNGVAVDSLGNIFIGDTFNHRIRKVDTTGVISTVAGTGTAGYSGDGGPATSAGLNEPIGLVVDSSGNLFIGDFGNNRVREVNSKGVISTVAGNGTAGYSGDGGSAATAELHEPAGVAVDSTGDIFIGDALNFVIRKVSAGLISTVAGNGQNVFFPGYTTGDPLFSTYGGDQSAATGAELATPGGVAIDGAGDVLIADSGNGRVRKVDANGIITTVAGGGSGGDGGPATSAHLADPTDVAVDGAGNIFISEYFGPKVRKVNTSGTISTVAGNNGELAGPTGVAVDSSGNVLIADRQSNRILKVDSGGNLIVVAGNGTSGYSGDGGPAISAELDSPNAVAVDSGGDVFIADWNNNAVRKVDSSGAISTLASIATVLGVAADANGNVFAADGSDQLIFEIDTSGNVTTVAGTPNSCFGCNSFGGDGGPAVGAQLSLPGGLAVNSSGDILYIADLGNNRIREVYPSAAGFSLSLSENGNGSGAGLSIPGGINCGATCSGNFPAGMIVTLNAYPASGSSFAGWSVCPGLGACSVTMNVNQSVTATFNLGPPPDFSIKAASATLGLQSGGQATDVMTVASQNGPFASLVQLSCAVTGSAPLPTCSLSATSVTPGANSATSTLTINAPAQSAGFVRSVLYAVFVPIPLALIGLGLTSAKSNQRKRKMSLPCSLLIAAMALEVGCGGGSSIQQKQTQNYTVTITGASGTIQHTAQVTVTVQ